MPEVQEIISTWLPRLDIGSQDRSLAILYLSITLLVAISSTRSRTTRTLLLWTLAQVIRLSAFLTYLAFEQPELQAIGVGLAVTAAVIELSALCRYLSERLYLERALILWISAGTLIIAAPLISEELPPLSENLLFSALVFVILPGSTMITLTNSTQARSTGFRILVLGFLIQVFLGAVLVTITSPITTPNMIAPATNWFSENARILFALALFLQISGFFIEIQRNLLSARRYRKRFDPQTGFLKPHAFNEEAKITIARCRRLGKPVSLMLVTVYQDPEKRSVHKTDGLLELAKIITSTMRQHDYCTKTDHGDYVILLPFSNSAGAQAAASRLLRSTQVAMMTREKPDPSFAIQISTVEIPSSHGEVDSAIEVARRALYESDPSVDIVPLTESSFRIAESQ